MMLIGIAKSTPMAQGQIRTLPNTGVGCPDDPATFRSVIAESGRFFDRHRRSSYRLDFLFDLAQAYETWWAVSQARSDDDYVVLPLCAGRGRRAEAHH